MGADELRADLVSALQSYQVSHSPQSALYVPFHRFIDRTLDEFWSYEMECQTIIRPTLRFDIELNGFAMYEATNPFGVECGIVVGIHGGMDMKRALVAVAHELVHAHEDRIGELKPHNYHDAAFHEDMFDRYGIKTRGIDGRYCGHDARWDEWLERNEDLGFERIVIA